MSVRIGFDFDGVLADTPGFAIDHVREQHGIELTRDDLEWGDGRPAVADKLGGEGGYKEFITNPEYVRPLEPLPGTRNALRRLEEEPHFEFSLVSRRPPAVHDAIERWLEANDLPRMTFADSIPEEKARASPPIDVLVDDLHGQADSATAHGSLGVHLTAGWESGEPAHEETVTVSTWEDAATAILNHHGDNETRP